MKKYGGMPKGPYSHFEQGLSLLEMLITLAILATLAGYAASSYHRYHQRGYRLAAITALYEAAFYLEMQQEVGRQPRLILPIHLARSPWQGKAAYLLTVQAADTQNGGYRIIATPLENGPMRKDACGRYELDATGYRTNSSTRNISRSCWLG